MPNLSADAKAYELFGKGGKQTKGFALTLTNARGTKSKRLRRDTLAKIGHDGTTEKKNGDLGITMSVGERPTQRETAAQKTRPPADFENNSISATKIAQPDKPQILTPVSIL